jgi:hypothetical protein
MYADILGDENALTANRGIDRVMRPQSCQPMLGPDAEKPAVAGFFACLEL